MRVKSRGMGVDDLHDSDRIVVEDGRDVFGGKLIGRVADEETCLPDSTVANDDASDGWTATSVLMASERWLCCGASRGANAVRYVLDSGNNHFRASCYLTYWYSHGAVSCCHTGWGE